MRAASALCELASCSGVSRHVPPVPGGAVRYISSFKDFLKPTSNILRFASEYDVIHWAPSNDAIRRLFELNPDKGPENSFQKNVRTFVENGGQTLEGYGILIWDGLK